MRMTCAILTLITLTLLTHLSNDKLVSAWRTKKASKQALKQIKILINSQIEKQLPQSDASVDQQPLFVRNSNAQPYHDELSINNPDDFFQGDVELSDKQAKLLLKQLAVEADNGSKRRVRRKVGKEPYYKRWDKRPISFDFADSIPATTRQTIREALQIWEKYTCVRFQENGPNVDRIEFYDGGGCSSFVGKTGGTQGISITTPGCDTPGIISHEVGHALGIFHEQARPDQERNIVVHYNNIPISRWNNFYPVSSDQAELFTLPYDAGSVMQVSSEPAELEFRHYGAYGFATNPYHPTVSTIDKNYFNTIGQRGGPSFLDIQAINLAYKCNDKCGKKLKCKNYGYPNPNDCSRCVCPVGLAGEFCEQVQYSTCGAKIQATIDQVVIETPSYPSIFTHNTDCYWLVQTAVGSKIYMDFVDQFDYECSEPCDSSFVEVKVKKDLRPVGYRFCCSNKPEKTFVSEGSQLIVIHRSMGARGRGFRARIWSNIDQLVLSTTLPAATDRPITSPSTSSTTEITTLSTTRGAKTTTEDPNETIGFRALPGEVVSLSNQTEIETNKVDGEAVISTQPPTLFPASSTLLPIITLGTVEPSTTTEPANNECMCGSWSSWISECTQACGGCGRRTRTRECRADNCRKEEKRPCNFDVCPPNTNFLWNNNEFHIVFNGCCVGLFESKGQCNGLDTKQDPFLSLIYKLLRPEDARNETRRISIPD